MTDFIDECLFLFYVPNMVGRPQYHFENSILRQLLASECSIVMTHHAPKQMVERGVGLDDVKSILRHGIVVWSEMKVGRSRPTWNVVSRHEGETDIELVVVAHKEANQIKLVTVMKPSRHRWT